MPVTLVEVLGEKVTEDVRHSVEVGETEGVMVDVRHRLAVGLALKDAEGQLLTVPVTLSVDDTVEVRHSEGEVLPDLEPLGEPLGEKVTEDVRHKLGVGETLKDAEGQPLPVLVTLSVGVTVEVRHSVGDELPEREPLGEPLGENVTEDVRHKVGVGEMEDVTVDVRHRLAVGLALKDAEVQLLTVPVTLCVDETVEVRHSEGEVLPVLEPLGEPLGEKVTDDVRHRLEVGDPLFEAEGQLLTVPVTLSVGETEEDRHSEGDGLPVRVTLGEPLGEKVTEDVRHSVDVGEPLYEAEGQTLTDLVLLRVAVAEEERHSVGEVLPVREALGERLGERDPVAVLHRVGVGLPL